MRKKDPRDEKKKRHRKNHQKIRYLRLMKRGYNSKYRRERKAITDKDLE